jgi:aldehyde:ferredoxin oxidoreductase
VQTVQERSLALEDVMDTERAWNERAGFTGAVNRLHEMLPEYYQLRGWSADGKVPDEKKQALGLTK